MVEKNPVSPTKRLETMGTTKYTYETIRKRPQYLAIYGLHNLILQK